MVASPTPDTSTGTLITAELIDTTCVDFAPYVSTILNYPLIILNSACSLTSTKILQLISGTTCILYMSCASLAFSYTCFTTLSTENPDNSLSTSVQDSPWMYSLAYLSFLTLQRISFRYSLQLVKSTACWGRVFELPIALQICGMMAKWLSVNGKPRKSDLYQNSCFPLPLRMVCSSFADILLVPFWSTLQLQPSWQITNPSASSKLESFAQMISPPCLPDQSSYSNSQL